MAFWQQQIDDLLTGIRELGGLDAPAPAAASPPPHLSSPSHPGLPSAGGTASAGSPSADAASDAEASLRRTRAALDEADRLLRALVDDAHNAASDSRARLQRLHDEVAAGVAALQPSMGTPAGRQQMADFLEAKAQQARAVVDEAQGQADRIALTLGSQFRR